MGCRRVFGFLIILLCLAACLCANAVINKGRATQALKHAKESTVNALTKAQRQFNAAGDIKRCVEERGEKVENAMSEAEVAAKATAESEAIVEKAKHALKECLKVYLDAKDTAEKAFDTMKGQMTKARRLVKKTSIKVSPVPSSSHDYTQVSEGASAVNVRAQALEEEIKQATALLTTAKAALWKLSGHAQNRQTEQYKDDAFDSFAKIETMLNEADITVRGIEERRDEVDTIVKEITDLLEDIATELIPQVDGFLTGAKGDLNRIVSRLSEAHVAKEAMLEQKKYADAAIAEVKAETDEGEASKVAGSLKFNAVTTANALEIIKQALGAANTYAIDAKQKKQGALKVLSQNSSKPTSEDTTRPNEKKPEQPAEDAAKKPKSEDTARTVNKKTETPVKDKNKFPAKKGGISTVEGNDDSAITVGVSLLLALVACASLH